MKTQEKRLSIAAYDNSISYYYSKYMTLETSIDGKGASFSN